MTSYGYDVTNGASEEAMRKTKNYFSLTKKLFADLSDSYRISGSIFISLLFDKTLVLKANQK